MKGTERRRELLEWLDQEKNLSLLEIVERFEISKMTAHRDLEALEQRNALKRIHGGVVSVDKPSSPLATAQNQNNGKSSCIICFRPASQHLFYSLTLRDGEQKVACCPHCGVSAHLMLGDRVAMALTSDYLTGRPHPAQSSIFLLGSVAAPCCKPSMLTFEDADMAQRFQAGFGGSLGNLEDATNFLKEEMSLHRDEEGCPHCAAIARKK